MFLSKRSNGVYDLWYSDSFGKKSKVSTGCNRKSEAMKFLRALINNEIERNVKLHKVMPTIDMFSVESLKIYTPFDTAFKFYIFKYGVKLIDTEPPPASAVFRMTVSFENDPEAGVITASSPPEAYSLVQNFPNPFNPATTLKYALPTNSKVHLTIYNVLGQVVAVLVDDVQQAGYKSTEWTAGTVSSGVYFYRLEATSIADPNRTFIQVRKTLLIK